MFVVYWLTSYSHLKQKINQCLNRVMCILQTQLVTLFFLYFIIFVNQKVGIYIIKSGYTSLLAYVEKNKFKIEKNTKILTGSAKYTENR